MKKQEKNDAEFKKQQLLQKPTPVSDNKVRVSESSDDGSKNTIDNSSPISKTWMELLNHTPFGVANDDMNFITELKGNTQPGKQTLTAEEITEEGLNTLLRQASVDGALQGGNL